MQFEGCMRIFQYIQLTVAVTEFFASAGVKEIFSRLERVAAEIGFDDVPLYSLDRNDPY